MNIVRCPRCDDDVTVPMRASPKALVRCPLCLEEYQLSEALGGLPPALIVLDGSDVAEEDALVAVGKTESDAGEYRLSGGAFGAALESTPQRRSTVVPARPVAAPRPKKREKNALVEMIKIVLGGALGLTFGYLILLWGFSRDVLDLGPKVAPYAPWIVPAKFHGKSSGDSTAAAGNGAGRDTSGESSPAGNGAGGKSKKGNSEGLGGGFFHDDGKRSATGKSSTPVEGGGNATSSADPDLRDLLPEENPQPSGAATTTDNQPSAAAESLTKAVLEAADRNAKVNEAVGQDRELRKQLNSDLYVAACEVGRIMSRLDASRPELAEQVNTVKTMLSGLAMNSARVSAMTSLTDLNLPEWKHDGGVLLVGQVGEPAPAGAMFACKFQAGRMQQETTVVSAKNPNSFCKPGDELLLVGRVVDDPQRTLSGYEGTAERVVVLGYAVTVPKPEPVPDP